MHYFFIAHSVILILIGIESTEAVIGCSGVGYTLFHNRCYKVLGMVDGYDGANTLCAYEHAHLVTIHDYATNAFVGSLNTWPCFIGLKYSNDSYHWIDGSPYQYFNWAGKGRPLPQESFGDCTAITYGGKWMNAICDSSSLMAICQKDAVDVTNPEPAHSVPWACISPNTFYGPLGTLESPGYPYTYGDNLDCSYFISVQNGSHINLEFTTIETRECCDLILIYDGENQPSPGAVFSGFHPNKASYFSSTNNKLVVRFITSGSHVNDLRGWSLNYAEAVYYGTSNELSKFAMNEDGECLRGWFHSPHPTNRCYKQHQVGKTFAEAKAMCEKDGAQMFSVHSAEEDGLIARLMGSGDHAHKMFWSGLVRKDGGWKSGSGSVSTYEKWAHGEPNLAHGDCVAIESWTALWRVVKCEMVLPYLCSVEPLQR